MTAGSELSRVPEERRTQLLDDPIVGDQNKALSISSDISAVYEIIRSNPTPKYRKDAVAYLAKLIEEGHEVDSGQIEKLYDSEKDITVATELKRVLNKLNIRRTLLEDPTSKYDKKLSSDEEAKLLGEIEKLKKLYDKSAGEGGVFNKKYRVIQKIADGGMGKIYKAIRVQDNQTVSIKFLLLEELAKDNDPERIVERFKREGEMIKRLSHPNVIKGFEYGEANGEYFLVMEHVEGNTLEDRLKKNPLDLQTFRTMASQLCNAVEYIHRNEIIHRDIKPGNILIFEEKQDLRIKLCDFGLAKDKRDKKLSKFAFSAGTEDYISPQQAKDARDADERDDIYSTGKTFYEMLTGRTLKNEEPYIEVSIGDVIISKRINEIIGKCINAERKDRWQRVDELRNALMKLI